MPIYEYRCADCGSLFEVFQKFSDDPLEVCENCGGPVTKVLHPVAIHFKGSGFYTTDYGRGKKGARPAAAESGDGKPSTDKPAADKPAGSDGAKAAKGGTSSGGAGSGASRVKGTSS